MFGLPPKISPSSFQTARRDPHQDKFSDLCNAELQMPVQITEQEIDYLCAKFTERFFLLFFFLFAWSLRYKRNSRLKGWLLDLLTSKRLQLYRVVLRPPDEKKGRTFRLGRRKISSPSWRLLNIGRGCSGQWWSRHPWGELRTMRMWHLGAWVSEWLMILEGISNLSNSVKPPQEGCVGSQKCLGWCQQRFNPTLLTEHPRHGPEGVPVSAELAVVFWQR